MPRSARKKSASGIYHVMLRGINRQPIFIDDHDNRKFIECLRKTKVSAPFELYAYCLMGNHVHLLIKETAEDIGQTIKRLLCSYVFWYNKKYARSGHLFQDRYRSEPVDTEAYLFTALKYIHQNPIKAEICTDISKYSYSSYNEYVYGSYIIDRDFILDQITLDQFINMHKEIVDEKCLEYDENIISPLNWNIVRDECGCSNSHTFSSNNKDYKKAIIFKLKQLGYSIREISELTGASVRLVKYS